MPSPSYAQNKEHLYKWRQTHYAEFRKIQNKYQLKYQKKRGEWLKIQKIYLQILLN